MPNQVADVIVVGAGNAAFCAALAAQEEGAKVVMCEAAPEDTQSAATAASPQARSASSITASTTSRRWCPISRPPKSRPRISARYTDDKFFDDMARVTQNRTDPDLCELFVTQELRPLHWMREKGVRFLPIYGRQAFKVDGKFTFWGGLDRRRRRRAGLIDSSTERRKGAASTSAIPRAAWISLFDGNRVEGVRVRQNGKVRESPAERSSLHAGALRPMRRGARAILVPAGISRRCEAPGTIAATASTWRCASVRSRRVTGQAVTRSAGNAMPTSSAASKPWIDYERDNYPFSIMVNADGKRFLDEGADIRNYTYAKYGRIILQQPGQFAWQIFDSSVTHMLRPEYRRGASPR